MAIRDDAANPGILKTLDRYWFDAGSPTTMGLFRICMGTLITINFVMLLLHWDNWYTETGYVPASAGAMMLHPTFPLWNGGPEISRVSLLSGLTDPRITLPFFLLTILAAVLTTVGLWTKVSKVVLFVGILSIHERNIGLLHGGDGVIRLSAFYLMLMPCERACSLDRLIGLWKGKISPEPVRVSMWGQRLVQYNVALLYFTTVWLKMDGDLWRQGIATWFPARLAEFYRFPVPSFLNQGPLMYVTTYGVLLTEFALATLVFFRPCRKYVLIAGLMMHGYIEYSMNIPLFSYLMAATYLTFYEGDEVTDWFKRVGVRFARYRASIRFPEGNVLRPTAEAFLSAVDPMGWLTYEPSGEAWSAVDAAGQLAPFEKISRRRSLGAWVFAWVPGLWSRLLKDSLEPAPVGTGERPRK